MSTDRGPGSKCTQKAGRQGQLPWCLKMAELREEKRHNIEFVFCNLDQPGFNLAFLPTVSVPVVGGRGWRWEDQ